jgi:ABC-type sugar transport system substrate-binding protein
MKLLRSWCIGAAALLCLLGTSSAHAAKVGVLLKGRGEFWSAMEKGAIAEAKKSGAELIIKAPLSESDISVQIQMLNALVAQNIEALVIAPSSKEALAAPVAAAAAKGIKSSSLIRRSREAAPSSSPPTTPTPARLRGSCWAHW